VKAAAGRFVWVDAAGAVGAVRDSRVATWPIPTANAVAAAAAVAGTAHRRHRFPRSGCRVFGTPAPSSSASARSARSASAGEYAGAGSRAARSRSRVSALIRCLLVFACGAGLPVEVRRDLWVEVATQGLPGAGEPHPVCRGT